MGDKNVLLVGECVLDIIQEVETFPQEDDDIRYKIFYDMKNFTTKNVIHVVNRKSSFNHLFPLQLYRFQQINSCTLATRWKCFQQCNRFDFTWKEM